MSGLTNPYAVSILGKPLAPAPMPQLRAEGAPMSRPQLDMARWAFRRFMDQARLSFAPNPSQHGFLPDGSRFRIMSVAGSQIMQVWPVVDDSRVRLKTKHGILLHYFDEVSKFTIVQYFNEEWKSIDVKSGRCGATIHPSAIEDVKGGNLFALTNYGSYDGLVQTETKFSPTGVSDPYPSSVGTSIFNSAVVDCEQPGVPVILSAGNVAFVTKTGEASPVSLYILRIPQDKPSTADDLPNIQLPDTPADTAEYADQDDIFYGPLIASSKNRSVVARIHSAGIQSAPHEVVTTGFCRELFDRTPESIPSHRLLGVPYEYDREAVFNIAKGTDGYELVHSINDISQKLRVVDMSSVFETVNEYNEISAEWTADYYDGKGMEYPEDSYYLTAPCTGRIRQDYSECRVSLPVNFYLECGSIEEKTSVLTQTASYIDDIFISSYFDFSGGRKELRMFQEINCRSDSKNYFTKVMPDTPNTGYPGAPTTVKDIYDTMKDDGTLNGWWRDFTSREATTEAKYTSTLSVGDGVIEVVSIDGRAKNNYPSILNKYGEHAGPVDTVTFTFAASVLNTLSFDGLTEILTGIRVDAGSGGEKEAPARYEQYGAVYFDATLGFTSYFEVYHKGILVFSRILDTYERVVSMTSSDSFAPSQPSAEYLKESTRSETPTYIETWYFTSDIQGGVCPVTKYTPKQRTVQVGQREQTFRRYEGELQTSDRVLLNISMLPTEDITEQFTNDPNISELAPPKTMIAIDPTSGGCAVVNDICKILISPEGKVTEIQDVTGIPDNFLKPWCASA